MPFASTMRWRVVPGLPQAAGFDLSPADWLNRPNAAAPAAKLGRTLFRRTKQEGSSRVTNGIQVCRPRTHRIE